MIDKDELDIQMWQDITPGGAMHHQGPRPTVITVTHLPTGIRVSVGFDHLSQMRNRDLALIGLKAMLDALPTGSVPGQ